MKPFLKWCGSKRQPYIVDKARAMISPSQFWVEPFLGSGALPLALEIKSGIFADTNKHLVELWEWVKSDGRVTLDFYPLNTPERYLEIRQQFNAIRDSASPIKSQLFYYLNQTCFNGLTRFNRDGYYNVPYGKNAKGEPKQITYLQSFTEYKHQIKKWNFFHQDFRQTISDAPTGSVIYCDPPYHNTFASYTDTPFTLDDQLALIEVLKERNDCQIIVSNSSAIERLYKEAGFTTELLTVARTISAKAASRGKTQELFATLGF